MSWTFRNSEKITKVSQFPKNTYGFVYKITHIPSGKAYIGKKVLVHTKKVKVTKKDLSLYEGVKGRKPTHKRVSKESDWLTYYGSNQPLKELVKQWPEDHFERTILKLAPNKKLLTYYETQYQFMYEGDMVLLKLTKDSGGSLDIVNTDISVVKWSLGERGT